jgi:hypothetical protein
MKNRISVSIAAAIAMLLFAGRANAQLTQYYNVDFSTLPNGPIELENASAVYTGTGWILSGDAVNLSAQTYNNVKYLNEWMFDPVTAFTYSGGNLWTSGDGNAWQVPSPDGSLLASQVSPVPFAWSSTVFPSDGPAFVVPTDQLPYINIGTVGPFASIPFTETVNSTSNYNFDFVSSFVSTTPVPEPSTLMLAAFGIAGLIFFVGKRRRNLLVCRGS